MNLTLLDWAIVAAVLAIMTSGVLMSRGYMRGVADFLAAGRSAGRYVIAVSQGIAGLGAITIVANLEMNYVAGFSMSWWGMTMSVIVMIIAVSGWVIYRFRETRCLTMAEFFERRYSRGFRIFAGMLAWVSGIINFGIFPAVGARFFINFCGLPDAFGVFGLALPTYPLVMAALLGMSLFFVFSGGQIAVIVTDFLQGAFVNIVFVWLVIWLLAQVGWDQIFTALAAAPVDQSLVNPFETSHVADFNFWFFLIGVAIVIYGPLSWQGTQGYNASARDAHEAKMGSALGMWRGFPQNLALMLVPIVAYTVMHHVDFLGVSEAVDAQLAGVDREAVRNQLRVPMVLATMLPRGLIGAFAAVMLAAFISTHDTYLHSWGAIFIQDVVLPLRRKPLSPQQHLRLLRWSITGVAAFIFVFSLLFTTNQYIMMFFAITAAIFTGGSGAVIIGGLYWKRATAPGAWAALLTGSGVAVTGIVLHQMNPDFPINGQVFTAISMGGAFLVFVVVSLLTGREAFDMDRLLHRGRWRIEADHLRDAAVPARGWRVLGMGKEFSRGDRAIYISTYVMTGVWFTVFVAGTTYGLTHTVQDATWVRFWKFYVVYQIAMSAVVIVWFTIGGVFDLRRMMGRLGRMDRDVGDDGVVR